MIIYIYICIYLYLLYFIFYLICAFTFISISSHLFISFFFFFLGIYDNYCVKKEILSIATAISQQILLVDEIIRAGKSMGEEK